MNRCVPRYWTNKELEKLREAKKVELNDWNKEVLAKITEGMPDVFSRGRTQDGLTCIVIETVGTRPVFSRVPKELRLLLWCWSYYGLRLAKLSYRPFYSH